VTVISFSELWVGGIAAVGNLNSVVANEQSGCDFRTSDTESAGHIQFAGALAMVETTREIVERMLGGFEAFTVRYPEFGF
jgi:hypothetical protein